MLVALLSDFGLQDHYVGVMKGQILRHCPGAQLVDISHQVSPQSIDEGAYFLEQSVSYFPRGTVFLCVVDPGVGSERKAVALRAGGHFFVAPDNGLLGRALDRLGGAQEIVELSQPEQRSATFHGRDIFAPAAGKLAAGKTLKSLGSPLADLVKLPKSTTIFRSEELEVTVLSVDRFGNVIFDFPKARQWEPLRPGNSFHIRARELPFCFTYSRVLAGQSLLLWNSSEYLELALRDGNAAQEWNLRPGERVNIGLKAAKFPG